MIERKRGSMAKARNKNIWMFLLILMVGLIIGSLIGNILAATFDHEIFKQSFNIGTQGMPAVINLLVLQVQFGLTLTVNIGTVIGVLIGVFIYTRI
jgi:uncharacterized membrane protein YfcA